MFVRATSLLSYWTSAPFEVFRTHTKMTRKRRSTSFELESDLEEVGPTLRSREWWGYEESRGQVRVRPRTPYVLDSTVVRVLVLYSYVVHTVQYCRIPLRTVIYRSSNATVPLAAVRDDTRYCMVARKSGTALLFECMVPGHKGCKLRKGSSSD